MNGRALRVLRISNAGGYGRQQMGGAERGLRQQAMALSSEVELIIGVPAGDLMNQLREAGLVVREVGPSRRIDPAYIRSIRDLIRELAPDVLHLQLLSASTHGRVAARLSRCHPRVVVSLHNDLAETTRAATSIKSKLKGVLDSAIERGCDVVYPSTHVAVGQPEAKSLRSIFRYRRVLLAPNELPPGWERITDQERDACRRQLGVSDGEFLIGAFMRLEESKGVGMLQSMINRSLDRWIVCGSGSVDRFGTSDRLTRLDYQRDVGPLMCACDAIVVPSRVESFGRTAVEALALGVPIVHTGVGGLPWVTADVPDSFAYQVPVDNVDAALAALAALKAYQSSPSLEIERRSVMAHIGARFSFETGVERWKQIYRATGDDQ